MEKEQEIIKLLKEYNQEHIIKLLEKLDGKEKEELINQINNIDFHQINELYQNTKKDIEIKENKIEIAKEFSRKQNRINTIFRQRKINKNTKRKI